MATYSSQPIMAARIRLWTAVMRARRLRGPGRAGGRIRVATLYGRGPASAGGGAPSGPVSSGRLHGGPGCGGGSAPAISRGGRSAAARLDTPEGAELMLAFAAQAIGEWAAAGVQGLRVLQPHAAAPEFWGRLIAQVRAAGRRAGFHCADPGRPARGGAGARRLRLRRPDLFAALVGRPGPLVRGGA